MHKILLFLTFVGCSAWASADDAAPEAYKWGKVLTLETIDNLHGGVSRGTKGLANLDLTLTIDTKAADWWDNGTWFVYVLGDYGGKDPSGLTGSIQTLTNLATDDSLKVYEFWYQQHFANDAVKLLVGLHDYNFVFYALNSARLFTFSSFGIGPDTSQVSPSIFSTTSVGVQLTLTQDNVYLLLATYDGVPGDPDNPHGTHIQFNKDDGVFKAVELGFSEEKKYKFAIGGWQKTTREKNVVTSELINNNSGFYIIGEKNISDQLAAFFQYGHTDDSRNRLDAYYGAGITLSNYWKDGDGVGLAVGRARNGIPFLQQPENIGLDKAETVYELTYFRPLVEHINGQASIYYVDNPGLLPNLANAIAVGARLYIEF